MTTLIIAVAIVGVAILVYFLTSKKQSHHLDKLHIDSDHH